MAILEIAFVKAITEYGLEKVIEKTFEKTFEKAYLFAKEEASKQGITRQGTTISDKYTKHLGQNLCAFYKNDEHIVVFIDGNPYIIPGTLVLKPISNGVLESQLIEFEVNQKKYSIPEEIAPYTNPVLIEAKRDGRLFDGKVVRLSSLTNMNSGAYKVTLQLASYYDAIATNFAMDHKPRGRSQSLRQFVHGQNSSLGDFSSSLLVNHIGVVCMIETADGMLVAQQRSKRVANRSNTISSSASGTFDWLDLTGNEVRQGKINDIARSCQKEVHRELGIAPENLSYLGALRDYERGGMPDFYFYARVSCALSRISDCHKDAEEKWESKKIIGFELFSAQLNNENEQSRIAFQKRIKSIIDATSKTANLTFYAGTLLTARFLLERPVDQDRIT